MQTAVDNISQEEAEAQALAQAKAIVAAGGTEADQLAAVEGIAPSAPKDKEELAAAPEQAIKAPEPTPAADSKAVQDAEA